MEAGSSVCFFQDVAGGHVHPGSVSQVIPAAGMIPSMGALLAGFGMAPTGIFLPGSPPASAVYSVGANPPCNVWNGVVMAGQHRAGGGNGERTPPPPPQKGPWTAEEDDILKEMVREHGDRKWAVIARSLPGRIGKQCRERWTNHLRPDIKKSLWTEEDDLALIEAHKVYGNRWSMIARFLPGRSENAVKNHWNATRRSLKAKRRLKKKKNEQTGSGQLSVLEEYIRSLYPAAAADLAAPAVSPPSSYNLAGYGELVSPPPATTGFFDPAVGMGTMMYLNSGGGSSSSASPQSSDVGAAMNNMNAPPPMTLDLNAYCYGEVHAMKPQVMMDHDHHHQQQQQQASSYANMLMMSYQHPFVDNFTWQQPSVVAHAIAGGANNNATNTAGHHQYYGGGGGGGLSGGRDHNGSADDVDVVQMASREFLTPSQDEVTLDLARFM